MKARAVIGAYTYGTRAIIDNATVGRLCSIAPNVLIGANEHPLDLVSTHPMAYDRHLFDAKQAPVIVGHDVWIGAGAIIMSGVRIGSCAVVGANAVVTHDIEPGAIMTGVPARPVGARRVHDDFVAQLDAAEAEAVPDLARHYGMR